MCVVFVNSFYFHSKYSAVKWIIYSSLIILIIMHFYGTFYNTLRHPVDESPNPNSVGNSKAGYEGKVF